MEDYPAWSGMRHILYPPNFARYTRGYTLRRIADEGEALWRLVQQVLHPDMAAFGDFNLPLPLTEAFSFLWELPKESISRKTLEGRVTLVLQGEKEKRERDTTRETQNLRYTRAERTPPLPIRQPLRQPQSLKHSGTRPSPVTEDTLSATLAARGGRPFQARKTIGLEIDWEELLKTAFSGQQPVAKMRAPLTGQQSSQAQDAEEFLRELVSRVNSLDRGQPGAKQPQVNVSMQSIRGTEARRELASESQHGEVNLAEEFLIDLAGRVTLAKEAQVQLKESVDRWWQAVGGSVAAARRQMIGQAKEAAPLTETPPEGNRQLVNNTFNVELRTEVPKNDRQLHILAERINRILIEQTRRHGIELT
jgi:hypothetical protein